MIGIYKIENLINGKIYIGQSINIHERWSEHKRMIYRDGENRNYPLYLAFEKYGIDNFSFEVIEECSQEKLNEREQFWIAYYHSYIGDEQCNGYNLTLGGSGWKQLSQDKINLIITLWEQGKTIGEIVKKLSINNHTILSYLKFYCPTYTVEESDKRGRKMSSVHHKKAIKQYDLFGNFIQEYSCAQDAAEALNLSLHSIRDNLYHKTKTCQKLYYFIFSNENQEQVLKQKMMKKQYSQQRRIVQKDLDNNIIKYYDSIVAAAREINGCPTSIGYCCRKQQQQYKGYIWEYCDDVER